MASVSAALPLPALFDAGITDRRCPDLTGYRAQDIIAWALGRASNPVISTNFRPGAAALLHIVTRVMPGIPVIWIDTGYNTPATYGYVETLRERWQLNLLSYTPRTSVARYAALYGPPPDPDALRFADFVHDMKIAPFERAFLEIQPDVWFTGVRREQTEYRASLGAVSRGHLDTLRVAPLYEWSETDVARYLAEQHIPDNDDYVDPTKPGLDAECGLQLLP
jgi:phosphoadenosine phosphosulfate reductase